METIIKAKNSFMKGHIKRSIKHEIGGGQSHFVEVIIVVLIVVVIGIFIYTVGVPGLEKLWNDAMALIGTIKP